MNRPHAELASYLKPELVIDVDTTESQEQLLAMVAERLKAEGALKEADAARDELLRREAAGSTAVGSGVALPHAVVSESLDRIAVAVVRLKRGINWHAPDGQPVRLLVVILASARQRGEYLTLLGEIARGVQQPAARNALLGARTAERVVELLERPHVQGPLRRSVPLLLLLAGIAVVYVAGRLLFPALRLPESGIYQQLGYVKFNAQPWLANQALTTAIFFGMILGTLLFWRFRVAIAATSFGLLLFFRVMNIEHAVEYMSLPTVIFIMAMMALIKWLENVGVFKFIVLKVVQRVGSSPPVLLAVLMAFSVLLSGFAGEVSGILVTFGLALELARRTKTPVMPYLLSLVFATNVGSALTLVGNPIGVYIAFAGGLTFESFLRWATPLALVSGISVAAACLLVFRKQLHVPKESRIDPATLSSDTFKTHELRLGLGIFTAIVAAIIFHARLEQLLRVGEGTMLMVVPLAALAFVIFVEQERGKMLIERGIDWWTLLFFMFLFANAACLEHTGVTTKLGYLLLQAAERLPVTRWLGASGLTGSSLILMLWGSGIGSGFVDNMPIVAALVPIVKNLTAIGLPHASILWWSLLFGGCFGGNLTMIGSSANLVAVGVYEKATGRQVSFGEWFRYGLIIVGVSLLMATVGLLIQTPLAP